jgi:hypothetical protein
MGNAGAKRVGMEEATTTIADGVDFMVTTVGLSIQGFLKYNLTLN